MSYSDFLFDKRILRRNLDKGYLSQAELNERLVGLRDLEGRYEYLRAEEDLPEDGASSSATASSATASSATASSAADASARQSEG